jgi:glycosyltransferase involved in cell wall biosynthesis
MPYATIIIPTFNRAETLPLAVESAQRQTVSDIEIAIVGDGPSRETADAARALAAQDARIVFHQLPKAPGRGFANRHIAVMATRSDRIFYLDDDDLMLPNHVEILGAALDEADVVDSCTASVALNGDVHIAMANYGADAFRSALALQQYKAFYDTHFAHSRRAYHSAGEPWGMPQRSGVRALVWSLAKSDIRWSSLPVVTALSFHGGFRSGMTGAERRAELEKWSFRLPSMTSQQIFAAGYFDWYLYQCLIHIRPEADETLFSYLGRLGVALDRNEPVRSHSAVDYSLEPSQRRALLQVFDLVQARPLDEEELGAVVLRLIYPLRNRLFVGRLVRPLRASLGDIRANELVHTIEAKDALDVELRDYLEASLLLALKRPKMAQLLLNKLWCLSLQYPAEFHLLSSRVEMRLKNFAAAAEHAEEALRLNPDLQTATLALAKSLLALGQVEAAKAIEARVQGESQAKLKQKLQAMLMSASARNS